MGGRALNIGRALFFVVLTVPLTVACTIERGDVRTPSGQPPEADTTRVRLVMEAVARAYEAGDLVAFDSLFGDSLTVFDGVRVSTGRVRYMTDHLVPQIGSFDDRRLRLQDIAVSLARSTAWATYRFVRSGVRDGGRNEAARGVGTMILERSQNRWRIVHIHASTVGEDHDGR